MKLSNIPRIVVRERISEWDGIRIHNAIKKYGTVTGLVIFRKEIPYFCPVDWEDYEHLKRINWSVVRHHKTFYVHNSKIGYLHRFLMKTPLGKELDHINCEGLDNRKDNLREVNGCENRWNSGTRCDNSTGVKGVQIVKPDSYMGQVKKNGVRHRTSIFETLDEAEEATRELRESLHGEFTNHG